MAPGPSPGLLELTHQHLPQDPTTTAILQPQIQSVKWAQHSEELSGTQIKQWEGVMVVFLECQSLLAYRVIFCPGPEALKEEWFILEETPFNSGSTLEALPISFPGLTLPVPPLQVLLDAIPTFSPIQQDKHNCPLQLSTLRANRVHQKLSLCRQRPKTSINSCFAGIGSEKRKIKQRI